MKMLMLSALILVSVPAAWACDGPACNGFVGPLQVAPAAKPASKQWYAAHQVRREALAVCALSAADLATTEALLAGGGEERNPLIRNRALRVGVSALGCYGMLEIAKRDPERGRKWARIALVVRGLAFVWNVRELTK